MWQDWSQETVDAAIAEGRPVYIDFTATWCLTCQLNKKAAYPDEVKQAFKDRNVLMLRADKTNANPAIEKAIADLDRAAIPVNVLYAPAKEGEPIITPANLTPGYLLDLLE
ncbi:thioredoxin family protein, partial [bacterium]|nr:thioredoxin family protein [bacterium]